MIDLDLCVSACRGRSISAQPITAESTRKEAARLAAGRIG